MLLILLYALLIGLFAVVYRHILAYEDILNWWFRFGSRFENKSFWKPVWGCEICIAGQLALWVYLLNWIVWTNFDGWPRLCGFIVKLIPLFDPRNYNALDGLIFVSVAVFSAFFFNRLLNLIKSV